MIWGILSSKILRNLIIKGFSPYGKLFDPERIKPLAGFSTFIKEMADVGIDFIKDNLFVEKIHSALDIENSTVKVVKYEGESCAVFKEKSGELHILKNTCPHAHCEVRGTLQNSLGVVLAMVQDLVLMENFLGIFAPSSHASERPMAMACFLEVTFLPVPVLSFPSFISCITFSTFCLLVLMTYSW
ncbi:Rieske 2Fe-2S domain-containing protein [Elizabethkingia ursingii]|nr:hypothetical protein ATB96_17790 [Elizabethkingia ursingii]